MASETVRQYYDSRTEAEWERLSGRSPEFAVTMYMLERTLPKKARILDVGSGPGRYAIALAQNGHSVTIFDLSENNLSLAHRKAQEAGVTLDGYICGNAAEEKDFLQESFDAVLCMGPLYHLNNEAERSLAIQNCLNVLHMNGIAVFSFVSRLAKLVSTLKFLSKYVQDCSAAEFVRTEFMREYPHIKSYLEKTDVFFTRTDQGFTESNFADPNQISAYLARFGLEKIILTAAEGLLTHYGTLSCMEPDLYGSLLELIIEANQDSAMLGCCEHFLYVGKKTN